MKLRMLLFCFVYFTVYLQLDWDLTLNSGGQFISSSSTFLKWARLNLQQC